MKVFDWNDIQNVKSDFFEKGSALTIGSFDGPHKGHESLFVSVLNAATEKNLISGIITFKQALPGLKHPVNYAGDIATLQQRLFQYENKGFDFVVVTVATNILRSSIHALCILLNSLSLIELVS